MFFPLYLVFFSLLNTSSVALPIHFDKATSETQLSEFVTKRTLFDLIRNCTSTIIICAWVSIHPNVPPSGRWTGICERLKLMFWSIIAPELILAWAVRQWFAAWEIRDTVNETREGFLEWLLSTIKRGEEKEAVSKNLKWTMAHGHLLEMGGITTVEPSFEKNNSKDADSQVLFLDRYKDLTRKTNNTTFELPKITEADIEDKSKGDFLSKFLAILQTSWFILQCIARHHQHLALTELELVTLALASLNMITYAFWWHKPLALKEPIRIYFRNDVNTGQNHASASQDHTSSISAKVAIALVTEIVRDMFNFLGDPCQQAGCDALSFVFIGIPIFFIWLTIVVPFYLLILFSVCLVLPFALGIMLLVKILQTEPVKEDFSNARGLIAAQIVLRVRQFLYQWTSYIANGSEYLLDKFFHGFSIWWFFGWIFLLPALFFLLLATATLLLPLFIILYLLSFIFTVAFGIVASRTVTPGAAHVPSFYAPKTDSDRHSRMVVLAFFGILFGGLHCIGWNFSYPTLFEQHFWRASSLAITVIPLIVAPIDYILETFELEEGFGKVIRHTLDFIMTILLFIYVPVRLSLMVQALALLRSQPQSAFLAVDWTKYIPHI